MATTRIQRVKPLTIRDARRRWMMAYGTDEQSLAGQEIVTTSDQQRLWRGDGTLLSGGVDHGTVATEAALATIYLLPSCTRGVWPGDTAFVTAAGCEYRCISGNNSTAVWRAVGAGNTAGGTAAWGGITGSISAQTDLAAELNGKQDALTNAAALARISAVADGPLLWDGVEVSGGSGSGGSGSGGSGDAVVDFWLQRIACAGGTSASTTVGALVSLFGELRATNIVGHLQWMELFLGDSFSAAKVPQMRPDYYTTFTGFSAGDWSLAGGLVGTGATKYISLNFAAAELGTSGNGGLGAWLLTTPADGTHPYVIGATSVGGAQRFALQLSLSNSGFYWGANTNGALTGAAATPGHYYGQRSSVASRTLYRDGASVATNTTSDATDLLDTAMCAMGAGGDSRYFASSVGAIYATDGELTAEQIATMHSALVASMAAIGRV